MDFEVAYTKRLLLRKLTPEVYKYIFAHYSDQELLEIFGVKLPKEKERVAAGLSMFNRTFVNFQIIRLDTNQCIGFAGFHTWYQDHYRAEIGYALDDEAAKNQGFMTEALEFIFDYGFHEMKLKRIEAFVGKDNIASLKIMSRFRFAKEGLLRGHYFKNDRMEDSVVFSLLKDETLQTQ